MDKVPEAIGRWGQRVRDSSPTSPCALGFGVSSQRSLPYAGRDKDHGFDPSHLCTSSSATDLAARNRAPVHRPWGSVVSLQDQTEVLEGLRFESSSIRAGEALCR